MSIKIESYIPPDRVPAPKKIPRTSDAPPFAPLLKLQELPVPPVASTEQTRRQHPKNPKHTRTSKADERKLEELRERTCEAREQADDPEADMCFVDGDGGGSPSDGFSGDSDESGESGESDESSTTSGASTEKCCAAASLNEMMGAGALDDPLDCAELANLLPSGGNDGIFDVILPSGDRLGVVVSGKPESLSYFLSTSSEKLASRLRRQRMELEGRLKRLTHRNVNITVL